MAPTSESKLVGAAPASSSPSNSNKASIASPKVSAIGNVELDNMSSPEIKLPLHEDIMQLARFGDIDPIKKLIRDGKFVANYQDKEGITPLHVCAQTVYSVLS